MAGVFQLVAPPLAVPDPPVELVHVTLVTPTLSLVVPLSTIVLSDVETVVAPGEVMVSDGAVASGVPGCGVLARRVTFNVRVTRVCCESVAVIVITLSPTLSGIAAMVQFDEPSAIPDVA